MYDTLENFGFCIEFFSKYVEGDDYPDGISPIKKFAYLKITKQNLKMKNEPRKTAILCYCPISFLLYLYFTVDPKMFTVISLKQLPAKIVTQKMLTSSSYYLNWPTSNREFIPYFSRHTKSIKKIRMCVKFYSVIQVGI